MRLDTHITRSVPAILSTPGEARSVGRAVEALRVPRGHGHASPHALRICHPEGGQSYAAAEVDEKTGQNRPGDGGKGRATQKNPGVDGEARETTRLLSFQGFHVAKLEQKLVCSIAPGRKLAVAKPTQAIDCLWIRRYLTFWCACTCATRSWEQLL